MATRTGWKPPLPPRLDSTTSHYHIVALLAATSLLTTSLASADCSVEFLSPKSGSAFHHRDTITVTYTSNLSNPTLRCFCGQTTSPIQKFRADPPSFNSSEPVLLEFTSPDPCWFELHSISAACGDSSPQFTVLPAPRRLRDDKKPTIGSMPSTATSGPVVAANSRSEAAETSATSTHTGDTGGGLSTVAKVGIGVAVAGVIVVAIAMFACFYLRRRGRSKDGAPSGRSRRKGRGKSARANGRLQLQPVLDGFPGSTGYDHVPSVEPGTHLPSPGGWSHSNSAPHYWTDREELLAARMNTPSVTSYNASPATVSSARRASPSEPDSREGSVFAGSQVSSQVSEARPRPAAKGPLIVSYGPNRITPTPVISTPAVHREGAVLTQVPDLPAFTNVPVFSDVPVFPDVLPVPPTPPSQSPQPPQPAQPGQTAEPAEPAPRAAQERKYSWDPQSDPATANLPLPPYASIDDFEAVEKAAVRTTAGPEERAELPPTKDGYYHFGEDVVEYELPAAAQKGHQPQLPYQLYRNNADGRGRELEEQKFLLSDAEIAKMRVVRKAARPSPPTNGEAVESYEMRGGPSSVDRQADR